jgi:hypothetical protein
MERQSTRQAKGTIETKAWGETAYDEVEGGAKLTRGQMTNLFHGDIEGEGKVEALMAYRDAGTATFVAMERVTGRLAGRSGSFVIQHTGVFDLAHGKATVSWQVVPGAGSGELRTLRGQGGYVWDRQQDGQLTPYTLEYDFE